MSCFCPALNKYCKYKFDGCLRICPEVLAMKSRKRKAKELDYMINEYVGDQCERNIRFRNR